MHTAVRTTTGMLMRTTACARFSLAVLVVSLSLFAMDFSLAQSADESRLADEDNNLSDVNLDGDPEPVRRVQRLGDVVGETEWEPGLSVPQAPGQLPGGARLPDEKQQQQLQELLTQLANNPGNRATLVRLNILLDDVLRQANAAIDANDKELAAGLIGVVQAVNPNHPGIGLAQERIASLSEVLGMLHAAEVAMAAGRVDQPEDNCAWYFYQQVLDQDSENERAKSGLLEVQKNMIGRAIGYAEEMDFESAERLLDDASYVREDPELIEDAQTRMDEIRTRRAEQIESRSVAAMDAGEFATAERLLIDLIALGGFGDVVNQLRRRLEEARIYGGFRPGQIIRDHFLKNGRWAPETVVILAGSYLMGSLSEETGREENEAPQHRVTIRRGFALGLHEVTVGQFRAFVNNARYRSDAEKKGFSIVYDVFSGRLTEKDGVSWEMDFEGKPAKANDPVIHVSWNDAQAYVGWLARGTAKPYRLPTEAEFEYALRGGTNSKYWWGDGSPSAAVENVTGEKDISPTRRRWSVAFSGYSDRFWGPAPVGSFEPNPFGLMDMGGNVAEWVRDCWHDSYLRAPVDGAAWTNPGCTQHVIRGGYWASSPSQARSAYRLFARPNHHDARIGFRIARDL